MSAIEFKIEKEIKDRLGRAGLLKTAHGDILTPAYASVGTKATVKALTAEDLKNAKSQIFLSNTYHLHLQPGSDVIKKAGGLHKFTGWSGPMMTDSGGFQVFSLGSAYGKNITKLAKGEDSLLLSEGCSEDVDGNKLPKIAHIDADGVSFRSHIDGSSNYLSPEISIDIQHNLGADIIFAFDECTSPTEGEHYQKDALERTHRWAKRCLKRHNEDNLQNQALFGIVQGGRFPELRRESALFFSKLDFDGYGIGGSFVKEDVGELVRVVNEILPKEKPRHMLGIGEPGDIFDAVENGCDIFDCVAPTRNGRNATLYTLDGKINITNAKYTEDFSPIDLGCECYTCQNHTKAYLSHLFRAKEMLAATLASIHNIYFINNLMKNIRQSILDDKFADFRNSFLLKFAKMK